MLKDNIKYQPKTIYYRGYLKSCNYSCIYCPFAKKKASKKEQLNDEKALLKFYQVV